MDILLSKVTQQAMNYAIRSGITITSTYAISQCSRLLKTKHGREKEELGTLQRRLESKIRIISPAIDMIELITARGNTSLESAVALTKSLRWDIQALGVQISQAAADEEAARRNSSKAKGQVERDFDLKSITAEIKKLLERIEDAVPLINLAITTSGVSLSTNLPPSISPSRLLQASTFLSAGDAQYTMKSGDVTQIGPTFTLSVYMLFQGHAHNAQTEQTLRNTIWQEVIHKAKVKLLRTTLSQVESLPNLSDFGNNISHDSAVDGQSEYFSQTIPVDRRSDEFAYQLMLVEDFEDDRVHTFEDEKQKPERFDDVTLAGIRETVPVHQISRIFYADTGKILSIGTEGETNNPVLLLKRDINAVPPRRMMKENEDELSWHDTAESETNEPPANLHDEDQELQAQFVRESPMPPEVRPLEPGMADAKPTSRPWSFPLGLDPEWIALEVYDEALDNESEADEDADTHTDEDADGPVEDRSRHGSVGPGLSAALSHLRLSSEPVRTPPRGNRQLRLTPNVTQTAMSLVPQSMRLASSIPVRTSLSLLEMLIRLTSLQQFQQASHLTINDELLNFFLEESSTTGAAPGDAEARKRIRIEARRRVGFDPYDESPIKRRGEAYQQHQDSRYEPEWSASPSSDRWQAPHLDSPSSSRRHNGTSPVRSRATTPLRHVAQRNIERNHAASPLAGTGRSYTSLATPPGTVKPRHSILTEDAIGSPDELTREDVFQNRPLESIERDIDLQPRG